MKKHFSHLFLLLVMMTGAKLAIAQAGSLDSTFGINGARFIPTKDFTDLYDIAVQNDGKIVTVGYNFFRNKTSAIVTRYHADGTTDKNFGDSGRAYTNVFKITEHTESDRYVARCVAIQPDGKIVVALNQEFIYPRMAMVRYNDNGTPDSSFGNNGSIEYYWYEMNYISDIALQPDGKIVAVGSSNAGLTAAAVRYNSNGTPDLEFGNKGIIFFDPVGIDQSYLSFKNVAVNSSGNIVIGGDKSTRYTRLTFYRQELVLMFLKSNGTIDSSYASNGIASAGSLENALEFKAMKLLQDDKILFCGNNYEPQDDGSLKDLKIAVGRYSAAGKIDESFGNKGWVTKANTYNNLRSSDIEVQADNKIIIGAFYNANDEAATSLALVRLLPDGSIDNTFGNNGVTSTPYFDNGLYGNEVTLAIQRDNKILAGGNFAKPTVEKDISCIITRYLSGGPDPLISAARQNNSVKAGRNIYLFPNPVTNLLNIKGLDQTGISNIHIFDGRGRSVLQVNSSKKYIQTIKVNTLAPGVYYLQIAIDNKITNLKFVKQ